VINEMTQQIKVLGPLQMPERFREWDAELLEHEEATEAEVVSSGR